MASPLQKAPAGLLSWLNLKVLGRNPQFFAEDVRAVVDVSDIYANDLITAQGALGVAGASPRTATLTVPQGTIWRVHAVSATVYAGAVPGVGASYEFGAFVHVNSSTAGVWVLTKYVNGVVTANEALHASRVFDAPLLLGPGARITGALQSTSAAADLQIQVAALYEVLER